jgi:hypothetical protein
MSISDVGIGMSEYGTAHLAKGVPPQYKALKTVVFKALY